MAEKVSVTVLTVQQPWAWLILNAGKNIENRTWSTQYRGPLYIHSSQTFDYEGYMYVINEFEDVIMPAIAGMAKGALLGRINLIDVVKESKSRWFFGPCGFVLEKPERLAVPYPMRGRLGLYKAEIPRIVLAFL